MEALRKVGVSREGMGAGCGGRGATLKGSHERGLLYMPKNAAARRIGMATGD